MNKSYDKYAQVQQPSLEANPLARYGKLIAGLVALAVLASAAWAYWRYQQQTARDAVASEYAALTAEEQKLALNPTDEVARKRYQQQAQQLVQRYPDSGYRTQISLQQAQQAADQGQLDEAIRQLQQVINQPQADAGMKQLAWLRLARLQMAQNQLDTAANSLKQVTLPAFSASRDELIGDIALRRNQPQQALAAYQAAWQTLATRQEPRPLLKTKLEALGVTPVNIQPPSPIRQPATS